MNSGCYGNDISKVLTSINIIDLKNCKERQIDREEINFFYRGSNLPSDLIITSVKLKGKISDKETIEKKQLKMIEEKNYHNLARLKLVEVLLKILIMKKKHGN